MALALRDPHGRKTLVIQGPWERRDAGVAAKSGITSMWVNYAHGFTGDDLSFLDEVPFIRELNVIARWLGDLSAIERMPNLEVLLLQCSPMAPLDLTKIASLREYASDFVGPRESVLRASQLRRVRLHGYPFANLEPLAALSKLQELALVRSEFESWDGAEALEDLRRLELVSCRRLADLGGVKRLSALESLDVDGCRSIDDLKSLPPAPRLRELRLADVSKIESLGPLRQLPTLERLVVAGDTDIVDGDLSPLVELQSLHDVRVQARRHYRPSADAVKRRR